MVRDRALTLVLMAMFLVCLAAQMDYQSLAAFERRRTAA
jgi:hypothetical protein